MNALFFLIVLLSVLSAIEIPILLLLLQPKEQQSQTIGRSIRNDR